jgi:hypothetical protein
MQYAHGSPTIWLGIIFEHLEPGTIKQAGLSLRSKKRLV